MTVPFTVEAMPPELDSGGFRCEKEGHADEIGDYLTKGDAARDQAVGFSRTFIVRSVPGALIAYYSLQADAIVLAPGEVIEGVSYKSAPAIKVARIGVRFITLDAVADRIEWYRRLGYQPTLNESQPSTEADGEAGDRSMYYDLGPLSARPKLTE